MRKKSARGAQECHLDIGLYNRQALRKITGLPVNQMQEISCKERAEMGDYWVKHIWTACGW